MRDKSIKIDLEDVVDTTFTCTDQEYTLTGIQDTYTVDISNTTTVHLGTDGAGGGSSGNGFDPAWYGLDESTGQFSINITPGEELLTETCFKNNVEEMAKDYPGLSKAWRNFKVFYDMCKSDYNKKKEDNAQ